MLKLPGLIDPHVHLREPGGTHKEDWDSGTAAALAGGFTLILAMPNTQPPVTDAASLKLVLDTAARKARCDYAQFLGACADNALSGAALAGQTAGLKMYLDQTYGPLKLDEMSQWIEFFRNWPAEQAIAAHAGGHITAAVILLSALYDRPVHICHVSTREEILLIRAAKERGLKVTCEVTPHHLFLSQADQAAIGAGRAEVRPVLATTADQQALWDNLDVIDCFATDHAPHTLAEKDGPKPPPGFPGLETALPLLLNAVHAGRLTIDDLVARCYTNPQRIYHLPAQEETWIEIDPEYRHEIHAAGSYTRCGWTPYEGMQVNGCVTRVVLRGREVFKNGIVTAQPGSGRNIRQTP